MASLNGWSRPLITVRLEVRILPGPPRSPMRTDVSRSLRNSPQFAGIFAGSNAGRTVSVAGRGHDSVDFGCRSLGSANPFLAPGGVAHEDRQVQIDKPSIAYWRDHSAGATGGYGTNFLTPPSGTRMGGGAGAFSALWRSR